TPRARSGPLLTASALPPAAVGLQHNCRRQAPGRRRCRVWRVHSSMRGAGAARDTLVGVVVGSDAVDHLDLQYSFQRAWTGTLRGAAARHAGLSRGHLGPRECVFRDLGTVRGGGREGGALKDEPEKVLGGGSR